MAWYLTITYYYSLVMAVLGIVLSRYVYEQLFAGNPHMPSRFWLLTISLCAMLGFAGLVRVSLSDYERRGRYLL